jgi:two-component system phosphate regulon sensor histidine kinase PhoR
VIGILGAYSNDTERFGIDELDFFRLAAGIVAVALDNARAFEEIEKLDNERFWFMMRVAHNLRAPLNANQSIINMMQGGFLGDLNESQKKYLIRIAERSQAMITTLNELMTLAETRNVKRKETYTHFNLNKIAGQILDTFTGQAMKKDVSFNVSVSDNLPEIQGDPEMIVQMFENLVSNGIKYTPRGGKVSLEISDDPDNTIKIVLKDTGIGIPKDAMPRLFTEFFRAENARKIEEVGTGLGLAIVRDIVHQHQGRIAVDSEEDKGTTFTIHLPFVHKPVARVS